MNTVTSLTIVGSYLEVFKEPLKTTNTWDSHSVPTASNGGLIGEINFQPGFSCDIIDLLFTCNLSSDCDGSTVGLFLMKDDDEFCTSSAQYIRVKNKLASTTLYYRTMLGAIVNPMTFKLFFSGTVGQTNYCCLPDNDSPFGGCAGYATITEYYNPPMGESRPLKIMGEK